MHIFAIIYNISQHCTGLLIAFSSVLLVLLLERRLTFPQSLSAQNLLITMLPKKLPYWVTPSPNPVIYLGHACGACLKTFQCMLCQRLSILTKLQTSVVLLLCGGAWIALLFQVKPPKIIRDEMQTRMKPTAEVGKDAECVVEVLYPAVVLVGIVSSAYSVIILYNI